MKTIGVDNLTKRFGHLLAVDHTSFEVEEGEIFGFLGANGAGKTSTIDLWRGWVEGYSYRHFRLPALARFHGSSYIVFSFSNIRFLLLLQDGS